jgi:hypothetical protein
MRNEYTLLYLFSSEKYSWVIQPSTCPERIHWDRMMILLSRLQLSKETTRRLQSAFMNMTKCPARRTLSQMSGYRGFRGGVVTESAFLRARLRRQYSSMSEYITSSYIKWKTKLGRAPLYTGIVTTILTVLLGGYHYAHRQEVLLRKGYVSAISARRPADLWRSSLSLTPSP